MAGKSGELVEWVSGPQGRVMLTAACDRALRSATERQRAQFLAYACKAAKFGFEELPDTQFKSEKRARIGSRLKKEIMVFAFKPWKLRIYGGFVVIDGMKTFLGTKVVEKKQNKADQDALNQAARGLEPYV